MEICVHGIESWRRSARIYHANDDGGILFSKNGLRVCATAQTQLLPTNDGNHPISSARNRTVLEKPNTFQNTHRRGRSTKELNFHCGTTSIPVPTGEPVDGFGTTFCTIYATTFINLLQGNIQNRPRGNTVKMLGPYAPAEPLACLI